MVVEMTGVSRDFHFLTSDYDKRSSVTVIRGDIAGKWLRI